MSNTTDTPVLIPAEKIHPFEGHPYKVLDNEEMNELISSIQDRGVMEPLTVRPKENSEGEYEIISGHRRFHAARLAGITELPAFIRAVSRDEAAIMLVDSNLHREHIQPSEKAFAYRLKLEALSRQGQRTDLTSCQVVTRFRTDEIVADKTNDSARQVQRYIRLTHLIPVLLDMVDAGRIAFTVGVELSFLDREMQAALTSAIDLNDCTPSYAQAVRMHKAANAGTLDEDMLYSIMAEEKPNQKERISVPLSVLKGRVPDSYTDRQLQEYVIKAVDHYHRYLMHQREVR